MNALILVPFHPQALEKLREKVGVTHESWMDTKKLIAPEEPIERIQKDDFQIVVIEADLLAYSLNSSSVMH